MHDCACHKHFSLVSILGISASEICELDDQASGLFCRSAHQQKSGYLLLLRWSSFFKHFHFIFHLQVLRVFAEWRFDLICNAEHQMLNRLLITKY
jgi:hypothetical protein